MANTISQTSNTIKTETPDPECSILDIREMSIDKAVFPGQREGETIHLIVRRHLIVLLPSFIFLSLMIIVPLLIYIMIINLLPTYQQNILNSLFFLIFTIYLGFVWIAGFIVWADYYLDVWIVTNYRLLDIEQKGFFHRTISELDLRRVQDISSTVTGLIPTIFSFGTIQIQTAAKLNKFTMETIPRPITVRRKIVELSMEAQSKFGSLS